MNALTTADKRRLTAEWAREFPELAAWRPLRLLRRVGPVVQGLTLDVASGGDYLPTAHVHALTREFPTISMTLPTVLRTPGGGQDRIRKDRHTSDVVTKAAMRIRVASPLALDGPISVEELVAAYRKEIAERRRPGWPVSVLEIEDQVLVPATLGRTDLVQSGLEFAGSISADWPQGALERWGRDDDWLSELASAAARRETLEELVETQIATHKLASLPFLPLA